MTQKNKGRRRKNYYCRYCDKTMSWQASRQHADEHRQHSQSTKESST